MLPMVYFIVLSVWLLGFPLPVHGFTMSISASNIKATYHYLKNVVIYALQMWLSALHKLVSSFLSNTKCSKIPLQGHCILHRPLSSTCYLSPPPVLTVRAFYLECVPLSPLFFTFLCSNFDWLISVYSLRLGKVFYFLTYQTPETSSGCISLSMHLLYYIMIILVTDALRKILRGPSSGDWDLKCDVRIEKKFGTRDAKARWTNTLYWIFLGQLIPVFCG